MDDEKLRFPKKPFKTGGIKAPHRKNTADIQSVEFTSPTSVTIPMQQHIGRPCKPTVKKGDTVCVGQVIGNSDEYLCAPIHASISGVVKSVDKIFLQDGSLCDAVVIESDNQMTLSPDIKPPVVNNFQDFLRAVRESGLVGLGGAGFPAHVKLNVPADKKVDTLIINAAECEPYITADNREIIENSWDIMSGIYAVKDYLNIHRVIIAIEDNKPQAISVMKSIADNETADPDDEVQVLALKSKYPQGAEKIIIQACTGRKVPIGKLPADAGCVVMNVGSVAFISRYLKTGIPLVSKRITVDGSAISEPKNVIAPVGTSIKEIIDYCGGYKEEPGKIIMGGPMMGHAVASDQMHVLKQTNAILAFNKKEAKLMEPTDCIRCGKCVSACPMHLMPCEICNAIKRDDIEAMNKFSIMACMECGSCSFVCPAKRHLVQTIRLGKANLRNASTREIAKKAVVNNG